MPCTQTPQHNPSTLIFSLLSRELTEGFEAYFNNLINSSTDIKVENTETDHGLIINGKREGWWLRKIEWNDNQYVFGWCYVEYTNDEEISPRIFYDDNYADDTYTKNLIKERHTPPPHDWIDQVDEHCFRIYKDEQLIRIVSTCTCWSDDLTIYVFENETLTDYLETCHGTRVIHCEIKNEHITSIDRYNSTPFGNFKIGNKISCDV